MKHENRRPLNIRNLETPRKQPLVDAKRIVLRCDLLHECHFISAVRRKRILVLVGIVEVEVFHGSVVLLGKLLDAVGQGETLVDEKLIVLGFGPREVRLVHVEVLGVALHAEHVPSSGCAVGGVECGPYLMEAGDAPRAGCLCLNLCEHNRIETGSLLEGSIVELERQRAELDSVIANVSQNLLESNGDRETDLVVVVLPNSAAIALMG
jgi:hypothetical protein